MAEEKVEPKPLIEAELVRGLVAGMLFRDMDAEKRDALLKKAIGEILVPIRRDSYGSGFHRDGSVVESAFLEGVKRAAYEAVQAHVAKDESFQAQVASLYADAARRVFEQDREKLVDELAKTIAKSLTEMKRDR